MQSRKNMKCAGFTLAGMVIGTLAIGSAQAAKMKTLVVAEPVHSTGYLPLYVAIHNGYFKEAGLDVKIYTSEGGGAHTNAVLTKQAFAFIGGPEHNAFAKIKGAELARGCECRGPRQCLSCRQEREWAQRRGSLSAAYFKGKNIATGFFGGTPNSITRYLLATWKLDAKKRRRP